MEAFGKKEACHFNLLITKSVPHILEKIFFSLDYESFNKCSEISTALSQLLSSERSLKLKKNVFGGYVEMELRYALRQGNIPMIRELVSSGIVDVNYMDKVFGTPLFVAAERGDTCLVKFLIEKGAEVNMHCEYEITALFNAASNGHSDVVKMLLDGGAWPDLGESLCLHEAAQYGYIEVLQLLLNSGAKINAIIPENGLTPLHIAAIYGQKDAVKLLLERGADHSVTSLNGYTALTMAQNGGRHTPNYPQGQKDVVNVLRQFGVVE